MIPLIPYVMISCLLVIIPNSMLAVNDRFVHLFLINFAVNDRFVHNCTIDIAVIDRFVHVHLLIEVQRDDTERVSAMLCRSERR